LRRKIFKRKRGRTNGDERVAIDPSVVQLREKRIGKSEEKRKEEKKNVLGRD